MSKIWTLDQNTMTLNLVDSSAVSCPWEYPDDLVSDLRGKVIVSIESYDGGEEDWTIHNPETLNQHVENIEIKSVWAGELVKGQEVIKLTKICEKDIKIMIQEGRS